MKKPPRILFFISASYVYGSENISLSVLRHLKKIISLHCVVNAWNDGAFINQLMAADIPFSEVKLGWFYKSKIWWTLNSILHYPVALFRCIKLLKKFRPDFVYHASYRSIFQLYPFLKKNNIYHVHDKLTGTIGEKIIRFVDKKISGYIAVSEFIKQDLISCGVDAKKINIVYNGISFTSNVHLEKIPKHDNRFHIGVVGQIAKRKGHLFLLDALASDLLFSKKITLHFFGTGDEDFVNKLKNKIECMHLPHEFLFHGYETDKNKIYQSLDFCLVPSVEPESFGLSVVEPALYGLPVIASDQTSFTEIIEPYKTGLIFENGNVADFIEKLLYLLDDPSSIHQLGLSAKKAYQDRFSEENMVNNITVVLNNSKEFDA